jgi:hypothetical protein
MANADRRSYDVGASQEAQGNLQTVIARLEALIGQRDADVKQAMSDFQADGVADQYHDKERRWNSAATEVRSIIALVRGTLEQNDGTAQSTLAQARSAVDAIG